MRLGKYAGPGEQGLGVQAPELPVSGDRGKLKALNKVRVKFGLQEGGFSFMVSWSTVRGKLGRRRGGQKEDQFIERNQVPGLWEWK